MPTLPACFPLSFWPPGSPAPQRPGHVRLVEVALVVEGVSDRDAPPQFLYDDHAPPPQLGMTVYPAVHVSV